MLVSLVSTTTSNSPPTDGHGDILAEQINHVMTPYAEALLPIEDSCAVGRLALETSGRRTSGGHNTFRVEGVPSCYPAPSVGPLSVVNVLPEARATTPLIIAASSRGCDTIIEWAPEWTRP
jgi:hypothetical protein